MRFGSLFRYLLARIRQFRASERGNVLMTFALATIPIIAFVGAAVDYSRGNSAKAAMQVRDRRDRPDPVERRAGHDPGRN